MNTPSLLPCPFCGATDDDNYLWRAVDGEWENAWIECINCGAQGPNVAMQGLPIDNISNEDFIKAKNLADDEASAAAATAWNQRSAWQPLPSHLPITPSAPHAFTEDQGITVEGIQGPYAHLNGAYVVDSASSFVQIQDKNGSTLDCDVVTRFSVGDETYLVLDPIHLEVCLVHVKNDGSTQLVEQSDKDHDMILSTFEEVLKDHAPSPELEASIAIKHFGPYWMAAGLDVILEEGADGADLDNLENPEEDKWVGYLLISIRLYHGESRGHREYGLYCREPDFYFVAKSSDFVLVEGDEFDRVRQDAEAAIDAVLPPAEDALPITP